MKGLRYDVAFKKEVISMLTESGQSVVEVVQKFGIHFQG